MIENYLKMIKFWSNQPQTTPRLLSLKFKQIPGIVLLLITIYLNANAQKTLNSVTLPAKLSYDKTELVLNGGGIRKKTFFKVYVVGLYLASKNKNGPAICQEDKPMALRLQITSSLVNSNNLSHTIREGFDKSTGGKVATLKEKIDAFIHIFGKEKIMDGDIFDIWYIPGTGIQTSKNDKLQGTIEGIDFKKALFGIWLSNTPVDADLKKGLLGL